MLDKTFLHFIIIGSINTLIGYAIILFLFHTLGLHYSYAYVLSYIIGMIISFFLFRKFVFFSKKSKLKEFIKFLIAFCIAYSISYTGLYVAMENQLLSANYSFILSMLIYSILFYLLNKYITFK
jgi:putative flippase GtrA